MKKKITKIILLALLINFGMNTIAQVAINNDGTTPDASAMLEVKSTTKGFLLPRMNTYQIRTIDEPADGLMVYNTDSSDFYGFNGLKWISMWNISDTITLWACGEVIIDSRDWKNYTTVQIGTQCWMAENLNIGTMIDGTGEQTDNPTIEKYCYDNNTSNCDTYGGLYQWAEIVQYMNGATNTTSWDPVPTGNVQGICPHGWHLPTDEDWKTMEMVLGMSQSEADNNGWRGTDEGEKMKSTNGWYNNGNGTNSSGFTALPGGGRTIDGSFGYLGETGSWWSSSEISGTLAWFRLLGYSYDRVYRYYNLKAYGFSVRCLKN